MPTPRDPTFRTVAPLVKLYHQARTAHLERAAEGPGITLLYESARYDFDVAAAQGADVRQVSAREAARLVSRSRVRVLEITEPAYLPGVRRAARVVIEVRLRTMWRRGRRPLLVTYAIANSDPASEWAPDGLRQHVGRALNLALARWLARRCDRIAFGTPAAQDVYRSQYGRPRRGQTRMLTLALPASCTCGTVDDKRSHSLVFVGAFVPRKGFDLLLDAWPGIAEAVPDARLTIIGVGELAAAAERLATADDRVTLLTDPSRSLIHDTLRASSVLTLPSRATPTWREQVGLPIVEGLQHGCTVVTTEQTGLAQWLTAHGHHVVDSGGGATELGFVLANALRAPRTPSAVLADLPEHDGRQTAEQWLFRL